MIAIWKIKSTGEVLHAVVTKHRKNFKKLINSHKNMEFIGYEPEDMNDAFGPSDFWID